ncbi:hypothetical protein WJX84_006248 [Apatococcus fuscideae]|uniref:Protein LTV1 homolog n=1 Tax=Apatococcus fuscideae TaxID=2026836 RepID=A0AAW1TBD7_9CHLO
MGRRKPFVDKKNSTTYNVIYREAAQDDEGAAERDWIEANKGVGVGRPDMDLLEERHHQESLQGRRYPAGPHGAASTEAAVPGPSVFVPASFEAPEVDRKVYDAHALSLNAARQKQPDKEEFSREVTAFSREARRLRQIREQELEEMQSFVTKFENVDDDDDATSQGLGDLLDDFVLSATAAPQAAQGDGAEVDEAGGREAASSHRRAAASTNDLHDDAGLVIRQQEGRHLNDDDNDADDDRFADADEDEDEDVLTEISSIDDAASSGSEAGAAAASKPSRARTGADTASVASTWRPERTDRHPNLSFIDERFEQLAFGYDSDQIGDLEEDPEEAQGCTDIGAYGNVLDQFLESFATTDHAHESGARYHTLAEEAPEEAARHRRDQDSGNEDEEAGPKPGTTSYLLEERQPEHWDCESVLTTRTNLDNHPGQISSGPGRPHSQRQPSAAYLERLARRNEAACQEAVEMPTERAKAREVEPRHKGESTDEKKERKAAVKDAKRAARANKKELRVKYKHEHCLNQKAAAGNLLAPAIAM